VVGTESTGAVAVAPVPASGSLSGERASLRARRAGAGRGTKRSRKVYRITDSGRELFRELLAADEPAGTDDAGASGSAWPSPGTWPQARLGLLERRRNHLGPRLTEERARSAGAGQLDDYTRSLVEHSTESTERDISWLDRLIESEKQKQTNNPRSTDTDSRPSGARRQRRIRTMSTIRVAIAGVGNLCQLLIQGSSTTAMPIRRTRSRASCTWSWAATTSATSSSWPPSTLTRQGGHRSGQGIFAGQNNTIRFARWATSASPSKRGPTLDGFGKYYRETVEESPPSPSTWSPLFASRGRGAGQLPARRLRAGPALLRRSCLRGRRGLRQRHPGVHRLRPDRARKFRDAGVPIIGDDIKSQVGSTIVHRILTRLFEDRGLALDHTYQLNVGGNMDFKNMLERDRLESKKISKTQAVTSQIEHAPLSDDDVHIGPSDHVPWLQDRKWAYIRMEGRNFATSR